MQNNIFKKSHFLSKPANGDTVKYVKLKSNGQLLQPEDAQVISVKVQPSLITYGYAASIYVNKWPC